MASPAASASAKVRVEMMPFSPPPLWMMARWIYPLDKGEDTNACTLPAPALCPKTVTLSGFPPKAAILFFTHLKAAS